MAEVIEGNSSTNLISKSGKKRGIWSHTRFVLIVAVIFIIVNNLIGLMRVSGHSMSPTLQSGNVLLINKVALLFGTPKYGDVVVVADDRLGYNIVKRVIAVEGDRVAIVDGVTYVNGIPLVELYTYGISEDMAELTVNTNELFVLGDNRSPGESLDSRDKDLGTIHIGAIAGYASISLWPIHGIAKPLEL